MIPPNAFVLFLILFNSCCVVAASLMAEKTNVGIAVFLVDRTNFSDKDDGITRWGKNKARP